MPPPDSPADHPRRLLAELGLSPGRRRGQTFLHDKNIARKIVAAARKMGPPFLEIGAGLGALTSLLAAGGGETVAVEGGAGGVAGWYVFSVRGGGWRGRSPGGGTVVGNLPYSLSSPIVLRLMDLRERFPRAVLMLQKEVVGGLWGS